MWYHVQKLSAAASTPVRSKARVRWLSLSSPRLDHHICVPLCASAGTMDTVWLPSNVKRMRCGSTPPDTRR